MGANRYYEQKLKWARLNNYNKLKRRVVKNIKNMTPAETKVWACLQELNRVMPEGVYWQRQYVVPPRYILDFCCVKLKLVIEVDGSSHMSREFEDRERDRVLQGLGYEVFRVSNSDVYDDGILQGFMRAIKIKTGC